MKTVLSIMMLTIALMVTGCTPPSQNVQLSAVKSAGHVTVTIILDETSDKNIDKNLEKTKDIVEGILKFLDNGKVKNLTRSVLKDELLKLVPDKLERYTDMIKGFIEATDTEVEVEKIGEFNVDLLKAFGKGARDAVGDYRKDLREKEEVPVPVNTSPDDSVTESSDNTPAPETQP